MNSIVTTNQKTPIDTQREIKEKRHNTKENNQTTKEETEEKNNKELQNDQKTSNKMALSTFLFNNYLKSEWIKCSSQKT